MSKKNKGGFTPRTEPTVLPSEPVEAPAVAEAAEEVAVVVEEAGVEAVAVEEDVTPPEAPVPPPSGNPLADALDQWAASQGLDTTKMGDRDISRASQALETTSAKVRQILQERWLAANPPLPVPVDAPDPEVVDGVISTDPIDPPAFQEPEKVTSVEVPYAHPKVEEPSPKADTLPPEAPDTDKEHLLPEGITEEEIRKGYEEYVAAHPGHHIIDVLHPRLKEMVPFLAKEVSVASVLELRKAAQGLLKREKAKGTPTTSEGIIQFESTSFALWLVDPGTPVPADAKVYFHKHWDVITILWGNRIALQATEQELAAYGELQLPPVSLGAKQAGPRLKDTPAAARPQLNPYRGAGESFSLGDPDLVGGDDGGEGSRRDGRGQGPRRPEDRLGRFDQQQEPHGPRRHADNDHEGLLGPLGHLLRPARPHGVGRKGILRNAFVVRQHRPPHIQGEGAAPLLVPRDAADDETLARAQRGERDAGPGRWGGIRGSHRGGGLDLGRGGRGLDLGLGLGLGLGLLGPAPAARAHITAEKEPHRHLVLHDLSPAKSGNRKEAPVLFTLLSPLPGGFCRVSRLRSGRPCGSAGWRHPQGCRGGGSPSRRPGGGIPL